MTKKHILRLITIIIALVLTAPVFAAIPQGEVNLGLGFEWNSQEEKVEMNSALTGFRLVLEEYIEPNGKAHLSAKGWRDWKSKTGTIGLDQVWYSGYSGDFDYTLGKQVISWGTADGFNPTNYFSRLDTNALFSGDMSGEPIWSGEVVYYGDNWSLTGVVVPVFTPQKIGEEMENLMLGANDQAAGLIAAIKATDRPKGFGKNSEWAVRAETQVGNFDVQGSLYTGYEALPGMELKIDMMPGMPPYSMSGKYRKQFFVGLATTGTIGDFGVWTELAYGGPQKFAEADDPMDIRIPLSINEKYLQVVVGGDYTLPVGKGLLVQGQYIYQGQGSLFAPYVEVDFDELGAALSGGGEYAPEIKPAHYLYGRLGYDFTSDISVDMVMLHGVNDKGGLVRPSYNHKLFDAVNLEVSAIKTYGKGELKSIPAQGRIAVKYSF
ncbi:MAG: hypothetical protein QM401_05050 [Bacillota bacterium]|nr:hypothetical protein [Bacillota bacterium]